MKSSIKKFMAVALVGGALMGVSSVSANAADFNHGGRPAQHQGGQSDHSARGGFDHGRAVQHARFDNRFGGGYRGGYAFRHDSYPRYAYRPVNVFQPGRIILGFNF